MGEKVVTDDVLILAVGAFIGILMGRKIDRYLVIREIRAMRRRGLSKNGA